MIGALFLDLMRAFNCMKLKFLEPKLYATRFCENVLSWIKS